MTVPRDYEKLYKDSIKDYFDLKAENERLKESLASLIVVLEAHDPESESLMAAKEALKACHDMDKE